MLKFSGNVSYPLPSEIRPAVVFPPSTAPLLQLTAKAIATDSTAATAAPTVADTATYVATISESMHSSHTSPKYDYLLDQSRSYGCCFLHSLSTLSEGGLRDLKYSHDTTSITDNDAVFRRSSAVCRPQNDLRANTRPVIPNQRTRKPAEHMPRCWCKIRFSQWSILYVLWMATNKATMDKAMTNKIHKPQVGLITMPIATQYKWYNTKFMLILRGNLQQIE